MKDTLWFYVYFGALISLLAVPLMLRRIGPNPLYGFRVPKTLENPDVWYPVNAYSGTHLFWIGLGTVAMSVGLYFVPRMSVGEYVGILTVYLVGTMGVSIWLSFRFMNRL